MKTNSKTMEGMEALRQIATTSLLIQDNGKGDVVTEQELLLQQSTSSGKLFTSSNGSLKRKGNNRVVPIIKEPQSILDGKEQYEYIFIACLVDIFQCLLDSYAAIFVFS